MFPSTVAVSSRSRPDVRPAPPDFGIWRVVLNRRRWSRTGARKRALMPADMEHNPMSSMPTASQKKLQHYETLSQAASRVQIGERTLRPYIAEGKLTAYRAGRAIRLKPQDVDALFTPTNHWDRGDNRA